MSPVKKILLIGLIVVCFLFALEAIVKWRFPAYDPSNRLEFHFTEEGFALGTPHSVSRNIGDFDVSIRINRHGFRDAKDLAGAQADSDPWFVVGDSFGFGYGVREEERFSNQLESLLQTPVYNISVPANGLRGYAKLIRYAERKGARVKNIIVAVCMENDLGDYQKTPPEVSAPLPTPLWRKIVRDWPIRHSALAVFLDTFILQNYYSQRWAFQKGPLTTNEEGLFRERSDPRVISSSAQMLLEMASGYRSLIVVIPSRALWMGVHQKSESEIHRQFVHQLQVSGLEVLDLRPFFERTGNPLQYHFKKDGHWNPEGHRLAAELIAKRIVNQ